MLACEYFQKWRTTACCLTTGSQCLTVIFATKLADYFRIEYGTPGLFLLVGALSLNTVPAIFVMKAPPWMKEKRVTKPVTVYVELPTSSFEKTLCADDTISRLSEEDYSEVDNAKTINGGSSSGEGRRQRFRFFRRQHGTQRLEEKGGTKSALRAFLTVTFLMDAMSMAMQVYTSTTFSLVHVDLAGDRGIDSGYAVYMMLVYSAVDYVTRVGGGYIIDRGHISIKTAMIFSFFFCAIGLEALALSTSLALLLPSSVLVGAGSGLIAGLGAPLLKEDFEDKSISILFGGLRTFDGLLLFTRPPLVGKT